MSSFFILPPQDLGDVNIAYTAFPRAYDYIIKRGKESNKMIEAEYKGISLKGNLYTAGILQRHILCIRHYDSPFCIEKVQTWREDDLFLIDSWFSLLINSSYLVDFHMVCINKCKGKVIRA